LDTSGPQSLPVVGPQGLPVIELAPTRAKAEELALKQKRSESGGKLTGQLPEAARRGVGAEAFAEGITVPENLLGATEEEKRKTALEAQLAAEERANQRWKEHHDIEVRDRPPTAVEHPTVKMTKPGETPRLVTPTEAAGLMAQGWDLGKEAGRPLPSSVANEIADLNTGLEMAKQLRTLKPGPTGFLPGVQANAPAWLTGLVGIGDVEKQRASLINIARQIIGTGLEHGKLANADDVKYATMLPTMADPPQLVIAKINNLVKALETERQDKLDAQEDAGFDVSRFKTRQAQEVNDSGKGADGQYHVTVGGKDYPFPTQAAADQFKRDVAAARQGKPK